MQQTNDGSETESQQTKAKQIVRINCEAVKMDCEPSNQLEPKRKNVHTQNAPQSSDTERRPAGVRENIEYLDTKSREQKRVYLSQP